MMSSDLLEKLLMIPDFDNDVEDIKRSISMNIKILLESRRFIGNASKQYPESHAALFGHGLADWKMNRDIYQGNRICRDIANLLEKFEPRLSQVVVERSGNHPRDNCLYFRIEAFLTADLTESDGAAVVFDTAISLTSFHFDIKENKLA